MIFLHGGLPIEVIYIFIGGIIGSLGVLIVSIFFIIEKAKKVEFKKLEPGKRGFKMTVYIVVGLVVTFLSFFMFIFLTGFFIYLIEGK